MYVMPRKPTFDHPVRHLRQAIGHTQTEFARLLGVGRDVIQSIENGRRPLSRNLAFKLRRQTGCVLRYTAGDETGPKAYEVRGLSAATRRKYTKEDFEAHQAILRGFLDEDFGHTIQAASRCVALLLHAAAARNPGTALALCEDFEQFVTSSFESYKLAPNFRGLLQREWADHNPDLDIEVATKNFPIAPLSTAYSFPVGDATDARPRATAINKSAKQEKKTSRSRKITV